jgi:hypothetical protein
MEKYYPANSSKEEHMMMHEMGGQDMMMGGPGK